MAVIDLRSLTGRNAFGDLEFVAAVTAPLAIFLVITPRNGGG
jgi:hypothetical protein